MKEADYKVFLIPIFLIYLFFALVLLTKDPVVFPDEVYFANIGYSLSAPEKFSQQPFAKNFPHTTKTDLVFHGPLFYLVLGAGYKIFGFSIYTTRIVSVVLGLLVLTVVFLIGKRLFRSEGLALS